MDHVWVCMYIYVIGWQRYKTRQVVGLKNQREWKGGDGDESLMITAAAAASHIDVYVVFCHLSQKESLLYGAI